MFLIVPGTLTAQSCEDCGQTSEECLAAPGHEVQCYDWEEDPEGGLEKGCDSFPSPCLPEFAMDITGLPAMASRVAALVPEADAWLRQGCNDAVLGFKFTPDQIARIAHNTEFIGL